MPTLTLQSGEAWTVPDEWCRRIPLLAEMMEMRSSDDDEIPLPLIERKSDLELLFAAAETLGDRPLKICKPLVYVREFRHNVDPVALASYVESLPNADLKRLLHVANYLGATSLVQLLAARIAFAWVQAPDPETLRIEWDLAHEAPAPPTSDREWGERV